MRKILFGFIFLAATQTSWAFDDKIEPHQNYSKPNLRINFNGNPNTFAQFNLWSQFWVRQGDLNPGSTIGDEPSNDYVDFGLRRVRFSGLFQLNPKYRVYAQVGINNQSIYTGGGSGTGANGIGKKPNIFFHDIYNELTVVNHKYWSLNIGAGLHGWSGISRLSNGSSSRILGADFPLVQFPHLERGDQFGRQLGIFAQGHIHKINYRFTVNKPFRTDINPTDINVAVDYNNKASVAHGVYAYYQFFDTESQVNPYLSGSYLGEKKILNIGLGYAHTNKNTMSIDGFGKEQFHDNLILGADVFTELPFKLRGKSSSFSGYTVWYHYNMGPNYLRTNGVMNPATNNASYTGVRALEGAGNNTFLIGTGNAWFTQVAWLLPSFKNNTAIQPFAGITYKNFEALPSSFNQYIGGINYLIDKHHAKISLQYSTLPIHHAQTKLPLQQSGEWMLQAQIMF